MTAPAPKISSCRACGCTDIRACPGGCWWIAPNLCSACGPAKGKLTATKIKRPRAKR